jgi:hypothetical protein
LTKHSMFLEIPVEVVYKVLPAVMKNGDPWIPEQIDIQKVILKRKKKGRKIDVLCMVEESALLAIEDQISESLK